jgi:hypothetical protein
MHSFFKDYLERLSDLHQGVENTIEGLPPEALDWTPIRETSGEMNSISVLVTHLCGAERYWIGDVACDDPSGRVRKEEFKVSGLDANTLTQQIKVANDYAHSALAKLIVDDLTKFGTSPRDGRKFTVGWALMHALEHTAIHLGHIQITRQMWNEQHSKEL